MLERKALDRFEEVGATDGATSSGGAASNSGAVKMISFAPAVDCHDDDPVVDLTVFDNLDGGMFALHVSQKDDNRESSGQYSCSSCECAYFDLFSSDHDDAWTLAPDLIADLSSCRTGHICTVGGDLEGYEDIIFDSGADVSALPLRFSHVGVSTTPNGNMYVDAQGQATRLKSLTLDLLKYSLKCFIEGEVYHFGSD